MLIKNALFRAFNVALFACCLYTPVGQASVIVGGTRVIFPAKDREVTVRLTNDNTHPALVEAWIDNGDPHSTPDKVNVPFLITPPLFRMETHRDQSLRVIAAPATTSLPSDRESLFWLNVLEIPPKPSGPEFQDKSTLQFAIRSRLKFFYRPAALPGDPNKAADQTSWKVVADGSGYALELHNPSPYHVTILNLKLGISGEVSPSDASMVAPFSTLRFTVKGMARTDAAGVPLTYDSINDYGASVAHKVIAIP